MKQKLSYLLLCLVLAFFSGQKAIAQTAPVGIFDGQADVGNVKIGGSGDYDPALQQYKISGSGANIWTTHDAFHLLVPVLKCTAKLAGWYVHRSIPPQSILMQ